jgi:nitroreductase
VGREALSAILDAAASAPSAGGLKAREFHVVEDEETKGRLVKAAFGQDFLAQAPIVLVFWAVGSRSDDKYGERGRALFSLQDATISATFAWIQAVLLGLGCCWVGAFDDDAVKHVFRKSIGTDWRRSRCFLLAILGREVAYGVEVGSLRRPSARKTMRDPPVANRAADGSAGAKRPAT